MTIQSYDIVIVGGGVAACSAGLFCARRGMKTAIIAKEFGGQTASTAEIENYPGIGRIEGPQLMELFIAQSRSSGCELIIDEMMCIRSEHGIQYVEAVSASYSADALILAYGKSPRMLRREREYDFFAKGDIVYGSALHSEQYRDRVVGIVGGGNSALSAVWQIAQYAQRIILIHRSGEFRGEKVLVDRLAKITNCEQLLHAEIVSLYGKDHLEGVCVRRADVDTEQEYPLDSLVVAIGFEQNNSIVDAFLECDAHGAIIVDVCCATSREGIFAAGDCTAVPYQQIVISSGEGAKAAISACQYVSSKRGKRLPMVDWGFAN